MLHRVSDLGQILWTDQKWTRHLNIGKVWSLFRPGCLKTVTRELAKCKLDLARLEVDRWDKHSIESADNYTLFYSNGNADHHFKIGLLIQKRNKSAGC